MLTPSPPRALYRGDGDAGKKGSEGEKGKRKSTMNNAGS